MRGTIGESITRGTINTKSGTDFTRSNLVNVLHFLGVHTYQSGDFNLLASLDVGDVTTLLQTTLVHSEVCQLTIFTFFKLECQTDKWLFGGWNQFNWCLVVLNIQTFVQNFTWVWQIVTDGIQDRLYTGVSQS